jgi:hypothetical protein
MGLGRKNLKVRGEGWSERKRLDEQQEEKDLHDKQRCHSHRLTGVANRCGVDRRIQW